MARRLPNWLKGYEEYTDGTESPKMFHLWVGLGTIAAAAQRKIYMDTGFYQVHTNMYIILVAPPGRSRKSTALRLGKGLLKRVSDFGQQAHFSTQASSVAALVKQFLEINNKDHQSLTAFSSELGSLLGVKSVEMTDFLVDIYDCEPDWDKQTVSRGLEKIGAPWFTLLAGTTPQWMGDNLSKTAVEGGFVSRSIFIFNDTRMRVAFPDMTSEQRKIQKDLAHDLAEIAQKKGVFTFSPDARKFYEEWYEDPKRSDETKDYRVSGYYERKHTHVLKVAMALSLAQNDSLVLQVADIQTALDLLKMIEPGMQRAFSGVGKNIFSTDIDRIKELVIGAKRIPYKQILSANIHSVTKREIDDILSSLEDMGEITRDGAFFIAPGEEKQNGNKQRSADTSGGQLEQSSDAGQLS